MNDLQSRHARGDAPMPAHHARRDAERLAGLTEPYPTLAEAAHKAGLDPGQAEAVWSASGLPTPGPDDAALGDGDVAILRAIADLEACGLAEHQLVLQLARVTGRHVRRIADAQLAAAAAGAGTELADHVRHIVPVLERTVVHVWRRHFADAATRATLEGDDPGDALATGFVDLVGFTARSQQLDEAELAELVTTFEHHATGVVARYGGTVVRTIGDEITFVQRDPVAAALTALDLVQFCDADPMLPVARGGMAWGCPIVVGGDYFGPAVS